MHNALKNLNFIPSIPVSAVMLDKSAVSLNRESLLVADSSADVLGVLNSGFEFIGELEAILEGLSEIRALRVLATVEHEM